MAVEIVDVRKEGRRIARQLREQFRARGEFTQTAFRDALYEELRHLEGDVYGAMIDKIADDVDHDSIKDRFQGEPTLPGLDFDLEGEYKLGDKRRVAKRQASRDHAEIALRLDDKNLVAVQKANIRKREELMALSPYWSHGTTKEQAVAACIKAHSEAAE